MTVRFSAMDAADQNRRLLGRGRYGGAKLSSSLAASEPASPRAWQLAPLLSAGFDSARSEGGRRRLNESSFLPFNVSGSLSGCPFAVETRQHPGETMFATGSSGFQSSRPSTVGGPPTLATNWPGGATGKEARFCCSLPSSAPGLFSRR
eukprot:SAG22_NODE_443_length_10453_cov_8.799691_7_plen_149_part_00